MRASGGLSAARVTARNTEPSRIAHHLCMWYTGRLISVRQLSCSATRLTSTLGKPNSKAVSGQPTSTAEVNGFIRLRQRRRDREPDREWSSKRASPPGSEGDRRRIHALCQREHSELFRASLHSFEDRRCTRRPGSSIRRAPVYQLAEISDRWRYLSEGSG